MSLFRRVRKSKAFALPTVLIASVVLLAILAVSVTATATVRTALQSQYYTQLAQVAGEAGVAYAKACLAANGNVPLWTDAKPLTPATDCAGNVILSPTVRALVVAGGGSGGGSTGGGGGAGGVTYSDTVPITVSAYPVVVGAGGATTAQQAQGNNGGNSSFATITTTGGGGGGASGPSNPGTGGRNGGSGGGGQNYYSGQAPGTGISGQGSSGAGGGVTNAGGGGGAGGAGLVSMTANVGGNGGPGLPFTITGSTVYYAAGGAGGNGGLGGQGGGGNSNTGAVGQAGTANTGSGGGGGWDHSGGGGGAGGSGVVIISYPINSGIVATATLTPSGTAVTPTTSNGYRIFRFTGNGTFNVTSSGTASCPNDPRCSVMTDGNIRSSFSVTKPTLDGQGRALTIPNSGFVEIIRESTLAVWRTYKQPSVQAAVVPDLCSGNATSARGWNAAVKTTQQDSLAAATSAQTISIADSTTLNGGTMYFRKDFNISTSAQYDLNVLSANAQDIAVSYIDGKPISTAKNSLATDRVTLDAGCHTIVIKLTNDSYLQRASDFTAALTRPGAASPVVVTDTSWRVSAGDAIHFSQNDYEETPGAWEQVYDFGIWNNPALPWGGGPSNWASVSGDNLADYISTKYSSGGTNRPGGQYAWFRNTTPFTISTTMTVRVTNYCDDKCDLFLDGDMIMSPPVASGLVSKNITIQPGTHTFGIRLYNLPSGNVGAFLFAAVDITNPSSPTVLDRSGVNWDSTTSWSANLVEPYSYDGSYKPSPAVQDTYNAKVLVVGGGGGGGSDMGGGGGGGAVISNSAYPLSPGTYTVTVGGGGTGAPAGIGQVRGGNGGTSVFGKIRALGGGGGGSEYSNNASPPGAGASAGGSAGCNQNLQAGFVIGQGWGSYGTPGCYYPTGGGGAGGPGATNPATGGIGVPNNILGTSNNFYWGGGGGGSGYSTNGGNGGAGGGGGGAVGTTTGGSGLNAGAAGGGGTTVAQTNRPGGNGGANTGGGGGGGSHYNSNNYGGNGGSGAVVISFPTSTPIAVSLGGSYQDWSASTPGFYTYLFTGNGTLTVGSKIQSVDALVVAGGGGGGTSGAAGGGGAGGLISSSAAISATGDYAVTVGAGGAPGVNGSSSSVFSFNAIGGGGGNYANGLAGGSGGGSGRGASSTAYYAPGTVGQGNNGGTSGFYSGQYPASGGGGAGAAGASNAAASPGASGAGGAGVTSSISGSAVTYAGGGGGGGDYGCSRGLAPGAGGAGGGGAGGASGTGVGVNGTPNTGGGGGGATQLASCSSPGNGGNGGSGIVILSYVTGKITATGGTITYSGGRTIHTFLTSGTFTVTAIQ